MKSMLVDPALNPETPNVQNVVEAELPAAAKISYRDVLMGGESKR